MSGIQRYGATKKKPSLGEFKRKADRLDAVLKILFDSFEQELFKQSIFVAILEEYLELRCKDLVTKGESKKQYETLCELFKDSDAYELSRLCEIDMQTNDSFNTLSSINDEEMVGLRQGAEVNLPPTKIKNFKKITFKEYERIVERKHTIIDNFSADYCYLMSMKITHAELLQDVMEQYYTGTITLADLKTWSFKWGQVMSRDDDSENSLSEYIGTPHLKQQSLKIRRELHFKVRAFLNELYNSPMD